jgi:hypothetical protein
VLFPQPFFPRFRVVRSSSARRRVVFNGYVTVFSFTSPLPERDSIRSISLARRQAELRGAEAPSGCQTLDERTRAIISDRYRAEIARSSSG